MKSNLLAGSLCAAGIIIPQIIFAGDKNREVTPDKYLLLGTPFMCR